MTAPGPAGLANRRHSWLRRHEGVVITIASVAAFFVLWQVLGLLVEFSPSMFASPLEVGAALIDLAVTGELWPHVLATATLFGVGFAFAAVIGIAIGLVLGSSDTLEDAFGPYLMALYAAPRVAFMPLLLVWFGVGLVSHGTLVFLSALFPITIATLAGARGVDRTLLKTARSFGASRVEIFTKVIFPYTIPSILAGLRLGVGRGLIGTFVAEMFGATAGLGFLIIRAGFLFQPDVLLGGVLVLAALSIGLTEGIGWVGRRVAPWHRSLAL